MKAAWHGFRAATRPGLHRLGRRLGLPGLAALALLTACAGIHAFVLPELRSRAALAAGQAEAARLAALRAARRVEHTGPEPRPGESFRASLPDAAASPARLQAVLALAASHGLALRQAETRPLADAALGSMSLQVQLPLAGRYEAVRAWLAAALEADPALTLDALRLRRAGPQASEWVAELRLTLVARGTAAAATAASGAGP